MEDLVEIKFDPNNKTLGKLKNYVSLSLCLLNYKGNADEFFIDEEGLLFEVDVKGVVKQDFISRMDLKTGLSWLEPTDKFIETERIRKRMLYVGNMKIKGIHNVGITRKQEIIWEMFFEHGCLTGMKVIKGSRNTQHKIKNFKRHSSIRNFFKKLFKIQDISDVLFSARRGSPFH